LRYCQLVCTSGGQIIDSPQERTLDRGCDQYRTEKRFGLRGVPHFVLLLNAPYGGTGESLEAPLTRFKPYATNCAKLR
jgi:hypothetical protein